MRAGRPRVPFRELAPAHLALAPARLPALRPRRRAHHLVNAALHAVNACLCFAFLRRATGATWSSLLVAFLFAVHPQRVESVAWASERKDVLSGDVLLPDDCCLRAPRARAVRRTLCAGGRGVRARAHGEAHGCWTLPRSSCCSISWPLERQSVRTLRAGEAAAARAGRWPRRGSRCPGTGRGAERCAPWRVCRSVDASRTALLGTLAYLRQAFLAARSRVLLPAPGVRRAR
jgi:hypothetical protein